MSKRQKKRSNKKLAYTPRQPLPRLGSLKTKWDLAGLYYKSAADPAIERDIQAAETACKQFESKWRKKDFTDNPKILQRALTEYEALAGMSAAAKPARYFGFRTAINVNDTEAQKQLTLISERLRKATERILFFELALGSVSKQKRTELLKAPELAHYRYFLTRVFLEAQHHLSEPEERIIKLKARQANERWATMTEEIVSNRTIRYNGRDVPIPEALEMLDVLNTQAKKKIWNAIMTEMEQIGEVAEHEFNAIITDDRTEDELRGYTKPYSATALAHENTEQGIENLVDAVSEKGFRLSKRFHKLKAKYHGLEKLHYTQKYDPVGIAPVIPFTDAVSICRDVFYGLKPEYGKLFDTMLTHGQIDVYPRKGKRGGAFMSHETGLPINVFLNHTDTFSSLSTLAHEMGHAIHASRTETQTPFYDGHSITTAETASTLFENLMFDAIYAQANEKEQFFLLHDRITRDIATIERQIAFFNCELEIHQTIMQQGGMANTELATCMQRHLKSYLGPAVSVEKQDGYSYVYVPHFRYGFYVYTYAFGLLMSTIMANRYKKDERYGEAIDAFLCAGRSDTVANIFKQIDIDITKTDTFERALDAQTADIRAFAQLTK